MNKPERDGFIESDPVEAKNITPPKPRPEPDEPPDEPNEPDEPALTQPQWPMVIKLMHKPIQKSRTETLTEISFREPTAMDIIRCGGNPCRIEITEVSGGRVMYNPVIDDAKMMVLMANLSGLLEPQIQKMDSRDYNSCAYRLRSFFLPEQGIW